MSAGESAWMVPAIVHAVMKPKGSGKKTRIKSLWYQLCL
jgi:hypothetical protein